MGTTPLHLAMEASRSVAWLSGDPTVDLLLENGADTSIKDLNGESGSDASTTKPMLIHVLGTHRRARESVARWPSKCTQFLSAAGEIEKPFLSRFERS
jgi:hypothetical protein